MLAARLRRAAVQQLSVGLRKGLLDLVDAEAIAADVVLQRAQRVLDVERVEPALFLAALLLPSLLPRRLRLLRHVAHLHRQLVRRCVVGHHCAALHTARRAVARLARRAGVVPARAAARRRLHRRRPREGGGPLRVGLDAVDVAPLAQHGDAHGARRELGAVEVEQLDQQRAQIRAAARARGEVDGHLGVSARVLHEARDEQRQAVRG
mmetsp:Transcript_3178/g.7839  ORF Transcript_3178/g.7839 Transcript_3178/m.7839 type:complete len:208 (+) Transcript_3178:125-748(+)